jgi:hypothetical protein
MTDNDWSMITVFCWVGCGAIWLYARIRDKRRLKAREPQGESNG